MHAGNIMDNIDFTEDEIQEQLVLLGYKNIPKHRLSEFKKDLDDLIRHGDLKNLLSQISPTKPPTASSSPNPPAFTKEKVGPCYFEDGGERFFPHAGDVNYDKRVRPACQNRDHGQPQGRGCDSYVRHSVAPKLLPPPGFPQRLQLEADASETLQTSSNQTDNTFDETLQLPLTDSCCTPSTDSQRRRCIKRKVLRKHKGQSLVCDESIYTEDSDAASCLEEPLAELRLSAPHDSEAPDQAARSWSDGSDTEETFPDAFETYVRGLVGERRPWELLGAQSSALNPLSSFQARSDSIRPKPKSFIRPVMNQKTVKKTDPVAKYFQYKRLWDVFKLPGEADRTALRLEIKERLTYQPPPPKPRRVYLPNTYTVPTEKKRSALRWEIRSNLANGILPYKFSY